MAIRRATLNELTYVAANLNDADRRELACQVETDDPMVVALLCLRVSGDRAWTAADRRGPQMCFGVAPMQPGVMAGWGFGTGRSWRVVPEVTRFMLGEVMPELIRSGVQRVEARSIDGHDNAHRWLRRLGARKHRDPLMCWGRGGEDFWLFDWIRDDYDVLSPNTEGRDAFAGPSTAVA